MNIRGGGADTLKFNLHIIGHAKNGCEFNQKRCEFKIFLFIMNKNAINNGNNSSIHVIPIDNYSLFFTSQLIANKNYQKKQRTKREAATTTITTTTNTRIIIWAEELQNPRQTDGWMRRSHQLPTHGSL